MLRSCSLTRARMHACPPVQPCRRASLRTSVWNRDPAILATGGGLKGSSPQDLEEEVRALQDQGTTFPFFSQVSGIDMKLDARVPPFHQEVMASGWPAGCDERYCMAWMHHGYEYARQMEIHKRNLFREHLSFEEILATDGNNFFSRLPGSALVSDEASKDFMDWLTSAPIGSVRIHKSRFQPGAICATFTNTPVHGDEVTLAAGGIEHTHVAVGFVDLSTAAAAAARSPGEPGLQLRWVGYDLSAHAAAKSATLAQMLADGAEIDEILQVWYSSTWSSSTHVAFQKAVSGALASAAPPVKDLLNHWQGCGKLSLSEARQIWLSSRVRSPYIIGNFVRKADRVALARYLVSGELLQGTSGSLTMFAVPPQYGKKEVDENFLQTIPFKEISETILKSGGHLDIIAAGVEVLRTRIACLAEKVKSKQISLEVHYGAVDPANPDLLAHIASLKPTSLSWSNVCDYYHPADFHAMARTCSPDGTHTAHMMNYAKCVKGGFYIDYLVSTPMTASQFLRDVYDQGLKQIDQEYQLAGYKELLLSAPVENARNVVDGMLFKQHHKEWMEAFFAKHGRLRWRRSLFAPRGRHNVQAKVLEAPGAYNPFKRTCATMRVAFTYADMLPEKEIAISSALRNKETNNMPLKQRSTYRAGRS
ncbi:hypothetical protein DUNSADRAFT_18789 [Dunaliella salina]|uniref:Uncharacterized protein n=1 Tax=Dunaliella salina TaxID=3046 RepID=A0ABQ7FZI0_DUNSA|nr:hypothetical protein DUNSADRAFT_18789 [Dunaliella salina]|eukprot:KAF5827763.1 hypothetical protein DUNSADRAFT_18789 [Dunaliella salina]